MLKIRKSINNTLNSGGKFIVKGFLIIIPVGITYFIVGRITNWIISRSEVFLFYVPRDQVKSNKIWYAVAVFTSFFLLWLLGVIAEKTLFGKNIDKWLDKTLSSIKGIGGIYNFANKLTDIFSSEKHNTGKPIIMPFFNKTMQQVGYITNESKIMIYHPEYKKEVLHYIINFPPAFALMGGTVVFVPEELILEYEDKYVCKLTVDEAFQLNLSGGSVIPPRLQSTESSGVLV